MRFAEPFVLKDGLSAEEKLEAERLMFMELTQSMSASTPCQCLGRLRPGSSLPLGQLDGLVASH